MTLRSGCSNCTSAPICGMPAESLTWPVTKPEAGPDIAPLTELPPMAISIAKTTRWSLRVVTVDKDLAASLA
jgi:hypothetical protein